MNLTWLVPPAVLGVGAVATLALTRRIAEALEDLNRSVRRIGRLEDGLIPVRVETRRVRESIGRLSRR